MAWPKESRSDASRAYSPASRLCSSCWTTRSTVPGVPAASDRDPATRPVGSGESSVVATQSVSRTSTASVTRRPSSRGMFSLRLPDRCVRACGPVPLSARASVLVLPLVPGLADDAAVLVEGRVDALRVLAVGVGRARALGTVGAPAQQTPGARDLVDG